MKNIIMVIKSKGKIILMPIVIIAVLVSIFIYNGFQKNSSAVVYADGGTYIEASGSVESNAVDVSSEVTGIIIESSINEGDEVKAGQIITKINNTTLQNQYDQAKNNLEVSEKTIDSIKSNINSMQIQNVDMVNQAESAYLYAEAEYEKVMDGASSDEIKQAEETVNQNEINLKYIKTNLDKNKELLEQGAISQSMFDETLKNYNISETQFNTALAQFNLVKSYPTESSIKAAQNKMFQAKAGYELSISNGDFQLKELQSQLEIAQIQSEHSRNTVEQSKTEINKTIITSPIDGVVNSLLIKQGEFIQAGKKVAEIYDNDNVEVRVYVSESNIGNVKVGQDVNVFVDSESKPFKGKVIRINNEAEFTPKNIQTKEERVNTVFEVKIEVLDRSGTIKPGMPVDVNIKIR